MGRSVEEYNILIVGLGSIGQRHTRNLHALGYRNLYAVSSGKGTMDRSELPILKSFTTLGAAFDEIDIQVVFVCNPTALHLETAVYAAEKGAHLFLEKPLSSSPEGVQALASLIRQRGVVAAVGFQFRQHPVLRALKRRIAEGVIGSLESVEVHWGEYLPAWHPWEDYRKSYSAVKELGGGVTFTLCHPLDYLRWMIGEPASVEAEIQNTRALEIDVDDVHESRWSFKDGAKATVKLDYLTRPGVHKAAFSGTAGRIEWDNADGSAVVFGTAEGEALETIVPPADFERNTLFLSEVQDFMTAIAEDRAPDCTLEDGIASMRMILAAYRAAKTGALVNLDDFQRDCL